MNTESSWRCGRGGAESDLGLSLRRLQSLMKWPGVSQCVGPMNGIK